MAAGVLAGLLIFLIGLRAELVLRTATVAKAET